MNLLTKLPIYRKYLGPEAKLVGLRKEYDGIIFGSTYSYWDFDGFSKIHNMLNVALPAQTISYDNRLFEQYKGRIKKGCPALISIMPGTFLVNEYENLNRTNRYYHILDSKYIYKHSLKRKLKAYVIPFARAILNKKQNLTLLDSDSSVEAKNRLHSWEREFGVSRLLDVITDSKCVNEMSQVIDTLDDLITKLIDKGLVPYLIMMPVSTELKNMIPDEYYKRCVEDNIATANKGRCKVIDLYHSSDMCDTAFYANADCMNKKGQVIFTKFMEEELNMEQVSACSEVKLSNGYSLPAICYGTGVVKRYFRNKFLFFKDNIRPVLGTIKNRRLSKKLVMDLKGPSIIKKAYENGFKMFDVGRIYGHAEVIVGKGMCDIQRSDYFVSTKISDMDIERNCSPNDVKGNFDISMKYLNTDYVDLYLLHWPHGNWKEIYKGIEGVYKEGRSKAIGVCNFTVNHLQELMENCEIVPHVCQTELHPLNSKKELREFCAKNNITLMAHTPTGRMCEKIQSNEVLISLAKKYNKTIAQIILRWHVQNGVIPVVATVNVAHMKDNTSINDFVLSSEDMDKIETVNENYVMLNSDGIDNPNYIYNL